VQRKLPNILSKEEVAGLIDASSGLFERTLLMVLYFFTNDVVVRHKSSLVPLLQPRLE